MIFYTLQGFVGKRAIPILQCGLNYSIAWPVVRVHSANPLRYPDGPLDVNVWGVWRVVGAVTVTLQQEERGGEGGAKEVNEKGGKYGNYHTNVCASLGGGGGGAVG